MAGPESLPAALAAAAGPDGCLRLDRFMETVLYAPEVGYYAQDRQRVGRDWQSDFYTSSSLGPVFRELVVASVENLLPAPAANYLFIELGAEPGKALLEEAGPFAGHAVRRRGQSLSLEGPCVLFANELLDAQPFRRLRGNGPGHLPEEAWVRMDPSGEPHWEWRACEELPAGLRENPELAEGYVLDWPEGAVQLLRELLAEPWHGLFLTFDYGLPLPVALQERPQGTGRTYFRHQSGSDLLADPGQRDITCHLIWNPLEAELRAGGCSEVGLQRQEEFLVKEGQACLARILERAGPGFSREKQTVMELLHPQHLGTRFQALWGLRPESR